MKLLFLLIPFVLTADPLPPKLSELDQLRIQNRLNEIQIKDLQLRLTSQLVANHELQLQLLRSQESSYSVELRDLSTFFNSFLASLVTKYGMDPDKVVYDIDKKTFVEKSRSK